MKINLHCHTDYSDGDDIFKMAREHKKQGFSAFVATDHVYPLTPRPDAYLCIASYEMFQRQSHVLESISAQLNFPCIQGMELGLWREEVLVFGAQTCQKIFQFINTIDFQDKNKMSSMEFAQKNIRGLVQILQETKADNATILCHPCLAEAWETELLYPVLDGYEFQNRGIYYFTDETNKDVPNCSPRPVPPELQPKNKFHNSDAHMVHDVSSVGRGNFHDWKIKTVDDVIRYIKTPQR